MNYKKFSKTYSYSRTFRYYKAAGKDKKKAKDMYYANCRLARAFQPLISTFEVVLRNRLHYANAHLFGDVQWMINQKTGFMSDSSLTHVNKKTKKIETNDFLKKEVLRAEKKLKDEKRNITAGRVIAELNLGFWNSLYEKHHFALLKGVPCTIFQSLPKGYGRKEVNDYILRIRKLRNRISHNEPLCFNGNKYDMGYAKDMYARIVDFLSWIDPDILKDMKLGNLDSVEEVIKENERIINKPRTVDA